MFCLLLFGVRGVLFFLFDFVFCYYMMLSFWVVWGYFGFCCCLVCLVCLGLFCLVFVVFGFGCLFVYVGVGVVVCVVVEVLVVLVFWGLVGWYCELFCWVLFVCV